MSQTCRDCSAPAVDGRARCADHLAARAAAVRSWARANPEKAQAIARRTYQKNKDKYVARSQRNRARKPAEYKARDAAYYERNRAEWFKRSVGKYGLTPDDYAAMLSGQGGGCAICGVKESGGRGRFHVDHDHRFAYGDRRGVRGLLCHRCNTGIGALGDNLDALERAMRYVRRFEVYRLVRPA